MLKNFSAKEAINVIVGFYLPLGGFYKDEEIEQEEIRNFIAAGYASLDDEYGEKYKINAAGKEFMHPYIKQISETFIAFLRSNCSERSHMEAYEWFNSYYHLDDMALAEDICKYICKNLDRYDHKALDCYSSRKGKFYRLEKVTK